MSYYERMKKGHLMMIENNRMMKSLLINMVDNYDNFLNSLNEITEETETRDIGVNTDYIDFVNAESQTCTLAVDDLRCELPISKTNIIALQCFIAGN